MDIFRIEGSWGKGSEGSELDTFELVAGFTPGSYIADGNWFGAVFYGSAAYPFVLTDDGTCEYAADLPENRRRRFTIVKRPVKVGEIFELTWDTNSDTHHYRVTKVQRLNLHEDWPDDPEVTGRPDGTVQAPYEDELKEAAAFFKTHLFRRREQNIAFRAHVAGLIESGIAVAVGSEGIEHTFRNLQDYRSWLDTLQ